MSDIKVICERDDLVAVADAIRTKAGITEELNFPRGFLHVVSNIETRDEYSTVEYIQTTGTQWFDTGVLPDSTTEIEMRYSVQEIRLYGPYMLSSDSIAFPHPVASSGDPKFRWVDTERNTVSVGYLGEHCLFLC